MASPLMTAVRFSASGALRPNNHLTKVATFSTHAQPPLLSSSRDPTASHSSHDSSLSSSARRGLDSTNQCTAHWGKGGGPRGGTVTVSTAASSNGRSQATLRQGGCGLGRRWGQGVQRGRAARPLHTGVRTEASAVSAVSAAVSTTLPTSSALALSSMLFTFSTAFVIPFYALMLIAPKWSFTRQLVESSAPYLILGAIYIVLLSLAWTPETLPLMFASKNWLPELPGIARMFSSSLTVSSAWIHLLAVDLFAGSRLYLDGLQHSVEMRHSLVLCLMFGPIGIFSHLLTRTLVLWWRQRASGRSTGQATREPVLTS